MPNKTIYIREADTELWEKAEKYAGRSMSSLLMEALRRYVEEIDMQEQTGMETIVVEIGGEEYSREVEFVGRWLLAPEPDETRTTDAEDDAGAYYGIAETQRGKIAVYRAHCNDGFGATLRTYTDFEEAENAVPSGILAIAARATGADYRQKLDI